MIFESISGTLEKIIKALATKFENRLKCLILYGSWAKGNAREDSDIDLLAVFNHVDAEVRKVTQDLSWVDEREITLLIAGVDEFQNEKLPLYTAIKREGRIIWGDADLSVYPDPPELKYSQFFERSREFEARKVEMAEKLLEKNFRSGIPEICFIAAKHAIQAALAMKGEGYSSKMAVLLPLTEKYFGKEISEAFQRLFAIYMKTEYQLQDLSEEEAGLVLGYAKEILKVYQ